MNFSETWSARLGQVRNRLLCAARDIALETVRRVWATSAPASGEPSSQEHRPAPRIVAWVRITHIARAQSVRPGGSGLGAGHAHVSRLSFNTAVADGIRPNSDTADRQFANTTSRGVVCPRWMTDAPGQGVGTGSGVSCIGVNRRTFSWGRVGRPADPTRDHLGPRHARSGRAMDGGARYDRRGIRAFSVPGV